MTKPADILDARRKIDEAIEAIENFCSDSVMYDDFQMINLELMMSRFRLGRGEPARFATLEQVERVTRLLPLLLTRRIPELIALSTTLDSARSLFYVSIPGLVMNVGRLMEIREQQSASGRGAFGRETLAQLREKNARLEAENAELRAKETEPEPA